ncbi:MAG: hypothetical protein LC733_10950, partial [Actinobacteria bacterium]|nr:hypothetical protein [Actinomycetota bacterium]
LVVKEVEDPETARLVIVLDLGPGGVAAERAAGRAAWYAFEALGRGYDVVLGTAEGARLVVGRVRSGSEINRRLAAAAPPGRPKVKVEGGAGGMVLVTYRGDSWH